MQKLIGIALRTCSWTSWLW